MSKFWPFVTASHHAEVVALLRAEKDRAEEEKRRIIDRFFKRATGEPVFFAEHEEVEAREPRDPREMTELERAAVKLGPRASARNVLTQIQRNNDAEYARERRTAPDISAPPREAEIELNKTLESGRVAASKA